MQKEGVLFFSFWYPHKSNPNSAIFIKRHAHAIATKASVTVLAFTIKRGSALFKKSVEVYNDENALRTHHITIESRFYKLIYVLPLLHYFLLKKYIRLVIQQETQFSVIHSNILFPCAITGHRLAQKFGCKHIISEHWSKLDKFFRVSAYKKNGRKALDNAAAITAVSSHLADTIRKYTSNQQLFIIPNVIDSKEFQYNPGIQKHIYTGFIAVAHWSAPKNPFYFLDALQRLFDNKELGNFAVTLCGEGPQIEQVKQRRYSFPIHYPGNLNANQLNKELNKNHVFLHGSDYETFSIVMVEALMAGLPCVVSPVGVSKDIITPVNGYITDNTPEGWEKGIRMITKLRPDHETISSQITGKYNEQVIGSLFMNVYQAAGIR